MARSSPRVAAGAVLAFLLLIGSAAEAATIGPGSGSVLANPPTYPPDASTSLDVHRIPAPLAAGAYSVNGFSFHNVTQTASPSEPGTVVPFLAVLTDPGDGGIGPTRSYQTIWVGASVAVANVVNLDDAANMVVVPYAGGVQQFSIPANTDIYAGIYTTGTARVAFRQALPDPVTMRVDHDTSFAALTAAGQAVTNISDVFYKAFYAFQIDVAPAGGLPPVPGDFDGDHDVDGADFVVWQTHFPTATGALLADGDADGDGDVDGADFVVWQTNFPFAPSAGSAPVPEPAAWILALVGLGGVGVSLRRCGVR